MYLLDTNSLSEAAPSKAKPREAFTGWLERNGEHVYLSVVSVTEISYGAAWSRSRGATRKADLLDAWLHDVLAWYGERVLPVDARIARRAGELIALARAGGIAAAAEDAWIAATADCRDMTVLTDNVRHFRPMGVRHVNPFDALPGDVEPVSR